MAEPRIWVRPVRTKRVTAWLVHCDGCDSDTRSLSKNSAEAIAAGHARVVHEGRAIVAVRKR